MLQGGNRNASSFLVNELDARSQASRGSAYIGKNSKQQRTRSAAHTKGSYRSSQMHQQKVLQVKGDKKVDALGQRVRQRFNEEIDYSQYSGVNKKQPTDALQRGNLDKFGPRGAMNAYQDGRSEASRALSAYSKKRPQAIAASQKSGFASQMQANQNNLNVDEEADKQSHITNELLQKLDEINGQHNVNTEPN